MPSVTLLTDIPGWVEPLERTLLDAGWLVEVVDLASLSWSPTEPPSLQGLVFNRIASNTGGGRAELLCKARDLLLTLELFQVPIINGSFCQMVGSSKTLQASVFRAAGVRTPRTIHLPSHGLTPPPGLYKPNVGGYGQGINSSVPVYSEDGCAVWQELVNSSNGLTYRAEFLDGELLYLSATEGKSFNACVGESREAVLSEDCPSSILEECRRVVSLAQLQVGSVEYLLDSQGRHWFIDINPVSSLAPQAEAFLGWDPLFKLEEFLRGKAL